MGKKKNPNDIVKAIEHAAEIYREILVGKRFMYVFDNRFIEVIYKGENFKHMTGVYTALAAQRFYSYAARHILSASQIGFNKDHPYALSIRKLKHIEEIAKLTNSECIMLEEISTATKQYKFGTTDLRFTLCLNRETDYAGVIKGDCYVVHSLRDEDCFSKSKDAYEVTHIFSRANNVRKYDTLLYSNGKTNLSDAIIEMLSDDLQAKFYPISE